MFYAIRILIQSPKIDRIGIRARLGTGTLHSTPRHTVTFEINWKLRYIVFCIIFLWRLFLAEIVSILSTGNLHRSSKVGSRSYGQKFCIRQKKDRVTHGSGTLFELQKQLQYRSILANLVVDEYGGEVLVRVVGYAGGGDGPQKLGLREAGRQPVHVLVQQGAQRHTLHKQRTAIKLTLNELSHSLFWIRLKVVPYRTIG